MQFVQVGMLGALCALAIPVIVHLMFRTRARTVDLGTLQFLKVVLRDNARQRKLRRWMLLALRLACVALIAFLFARPYLLATEPVGGDRLVVVLLDRSASMGLKGDSRPIDRALAEAGKLIGQAGKGTQLEVATFDRTVHPLKTPADLRKAPPELSAAGTDYGAALAWARDLCVRSRSRTRELHILTDLQRSGLDRSESVTIPANVQTHLTDFGRAFPKNVAVINARVDPPMIRPGESATISATVFNSAPLPVAKVPVRLHIEASGKTRDLEKTIDLDGRATSTLEFSVAEIPEGLWRGHVEAAIGDDLSFDDRRYLALNVAPPARVLLVDGKPGRTAYDSGTYFLEAALRLAPAAERFAKSPFDTRTTDLIGDAPLPDLATTEAVVLANVVNLSAADTRKLAEFVDRGGGLLVFTGDRVTAESARGLESAGLGIGEVVGPALATELPWRLDRWDARHPVFHPFADPEHGDLRRSMFTTITRIKPAADARVLAWFRGGEPAVLEHTHGKGRVLWFASACDRTWSDWPRSRLYLPVVHQMLSYACGLTDGGRVRQESAGDGRPPGVSESERVVHVINADRLESDTARCTPREFAARFGLRLPEPATVAKKPSTRGLSDDRLRGDEIWPWLALTLFGFLLLENFLANRTAA